MFARLLPLLCLSHALFASVTMTTSVNDVYSRGTSELGGSINFTLHGGDFREASSAYPHFIRLQTDHGSVLTETRVEQASANPAINRPIHLPLRVGGEGTTMVAAPDAVSIVRWVAGESAVWIRVQQSSDEWLNNGADHGPNPDQPVSFSIGQSARISDRFNDKDAAQKNANLPFNTRETTAAEGDFAQAASTLYCNNFSMSNLLSNGTGESLLQYDIVAFDHNADIGNGVYSAHSGNILEIHFTNDFRIGRGKTRDCSLMSVVQGSGGTGAGSGGLTRYTKDLTLQYGCATGPDYLESFLEPGSTVTVEALVPGFGFEDGGVRLTINGMSASSTTGDPASMININGVDLFTRLDVIWTGNAVDLTTELDLALDFQYDGGALPDFQVSLALGQVPEQAPTDAAPYDGADQHRRCPPSVIPLGGQSLTIDGPTR